MKIRPTSRTLNYIRQHGWEADIVERWNPYAGRFGRRIDLFGLIDIIAIGEGKIIGIQSCGSDFAKHKKRILQNPLAFQWLQAGGRLLLIGWRKIKLKRGGKVLRWAPRIWEFSFSDFIKQTNSEEDSGRLREKKARRKEQL